IMKSRITRLATAAAIIIAAGILLRSLNDGTAWAKVVKAFNQADNIHVVKKERSSDGRIIRENESWVKNQTLFRAESNNWCVINDGSKVLSLYKDQQIADLRESVTPHWDYTPIVLKVFQGAETTKGTTITMLPEECTNEMDVYEISFRDQWQGKAWVDASNKLPVRILGREKEDSGRKKEFEIMLRYEPIPDETFDTAVPASFQELPRIANRPRSEEREVLFGKVVDEQGNPVADAEVYASYANHGRTDEKGEFALLVHPDDGSNSLGPADFPIFLRAFRKEEPQRVAWTIIRHPASRDLVFSGVNVLNSRSRVEEQNKGKEELSEGPKVERTHHGVDLLFEDDRVLAENIPGDPGELFGDIDDEPKVRNIKLVMGEASTITGRITNASSEPIANATILIEEMKQHIGINTIAVRNLGSELEDKAFAITDSGGYFELNNLPANWDNVQVKVTSRGYRTVEKEFERGGRTVVEGCDFELVAGEQEEVLKRENRYFGSILASSRGAEREFQHLQEVLADGHPIKAGGGSIAETVPSGLHQNLVLYYSFQASTDPDVAVDISGNGFNGSINGAQYSNDEVLGGVMSFDGEDDCISVSDVYLKEFSFSAWVKTHGSGVNNRRIFTLSDGGQCYGLQGNVGGGVGVYVGDNEEVNEYNWRLGKYQWTHITVTHDGRRFAIYRNGKLTETGNIETGGVEGTLYLGGTSKHRGGFWNGMIDEVAIFNRALNKEEVEQLYRMTGEVVEAPARPEAMEAANEVIEPDEVDSTSLPKHTIATDFGGGMVYPADVDGDGDLDVVAAAKGNDRRFFISTRSGISSSSRRGRPEILSKSSQVEDRSGVFWWENTDGRGTAWMKHTVDANVKSVQNAYPADVDGDGDVDLIGSSSDRNMVWWENSSGNGSVWGKHAIDSSVSGTQLVHAADFDSDGDIDVVGATWLDGGINWWENAGGNGTSWQKHAIDGAMNADYSRTHCMSVADMDGDGKLDVVTSAGSESGVNWWENPKVSGADWTRHYVIGSDGEVESVYAGDLDGDGNMDLIGSIRRREGLVWWENTNGTAAVWTKHILDSSYHAEQSVDVADMDGDGDLDILGAAQRINEIRWWENKNTDAKEWSKHIISTSYGSAYAVDMDSDGDLDVLGVGEDSGWIVWYENKPNVD
ncbi:MAG: FG-GAP-like repeat-containing protein, partial [Planctomycetota bacterium]